MVPYGWKENETLLLFKKNVEPRQREIRRGSEGEVKNFPEEASARAQCIA